MKAINSDTVLVDSYFKLLNNLSRSVKVDLISKLSQSIKADENLALNENNDAFGGWEGDERAEELIQSIKASRNFNRQVEEM